MVKVLRYKESFRKAAARALVEIGDAQTIEGIVEAIKEGHDFDVRWAAQQALQDIRDPRAVEPLIAALHDNNYSGCEVVAKILGNIGDARAVEPLITKLQKREFFNDDWEVIKALGNIRDARAVEPLIATIKDGGGDECMRKQIIIALANFDDAYVIDFLSALATHPSRLREAEEAMIALKRIGVEQLVDALNTQNKDAREVIAI